MINVFRIIGGLFFIGLSIWGILSFNAAYDTLSGAEKVETAPLVLQGLVRAVGGACFVWGLMIIAKINKKARQWLEEK